MGTSIIKFFCGTSGTSERKKQHLNIWLKCFGGMSVAGHSRGCWGSWAPERVAGDGAFRMGYLAFSGELLKKLQLEQSECRNNFNGHIYQNGTTSSRGAGQRGSKSKGAVRHSFAEHSRHKTTPIDPPDRPPSPSQNRDPQFQVKLPPLTNKITNPNYQL